MSKFGLRDLGFGTGEEEEDDDGDRTWEEGTGDDGREADGFSIAMLGNRMLTLTRTRGKKEYEKACWKRTLYAEAKGAER
jgi:hypothetical protein